MSARPGDSDRQLTTGELPPILDTVGVAELLGIATNTVRGMVRAGRLPAHRVPGGRKYQFFTEEVLGALGRDGGPTSALASAPTTSPVPAPTPAVAIATDPCDVWGAVPAERGPGWAERCLDHWFTLAVDAGLDAACVTGPSEQTRGPCVGIVAVDDLCYRVLVGPRKRARVVDEDGEDRWGLVDAVWVEPVLDPGE